MADRPILFSAPMVRSLLSGSKTQTRRILATPDITFDAIFNDDGVWYFGDALTGRREAKLPVRTKIGDRLYVREHWRASRDFDRYAPRDLKPGLRPIWYEAGYMMDTGHQKFFSTKQGADFDASQVKGKHRQAMHMPRWASRITLLVENVKVERLQDISEDDAIAEGVVDMGRRDGEPYSHCHIPGVPSIRVEHDAVPVYAQLWEMINGEGSWAANPWIYAVSFRVVMGNIDQIGGAA